MRRIRYVLLSVLVVFSIATPDVVFAQTAGELNQTNNLETSLQNDLQKVLNNPNDSFAYQDLGTIYQESGDSSVHIFVDGIQPSFDVLPFISNSRTFIPVSAVATALGDQVAWDSVKQTVTISNSFHTIKLTINAHTIIVDNKSETMDVAPFIINGRTVVPLRFINDALGTSLQWYPAGQIVAVSTSYNIPVPAIKQTPELYNGCEATSLTMLLNWSGLSISKLEVARDVVKDPTPEVMDASGNIVSWGDPNDGFVGDITGYNPGYAVYHGPITNLLNKYLPGQALDMTGSSFVQLLDHVRSGKPVLAWTTVDFTPTNSWTTWQGPNGNVRATFNEHCVLIVGVDETHNILYINDPLDGTAAKPVSLTQFQLSWDQLGSQAVSIR